MVGVSYITYTSNSYVPYLIGCVAAPDIEICDMI